MSFFWECVCFFLKVMLFCGLEIDFIGSECDSFFVLILCFGVVDMEIWIWEFLIIKVILLLIILVLIRFVMLIMVVEVLIVLSCKFIISYFNILYKFNGKYYLRCLNLLFLLFKC